MHDHHGHGHRFMDINRLRSPERLERLEVDRVVDLALQGEEIQNVLDIGTGTGIFAEAFSLRGKTVTGIDVNPEMLETARRYATQVGFQSAAAENLPFPDQSYDLVFMGLVLHETDDLLKSLKEANRVTREWLAVLEWPYQQQEIGPELGERLPRDQVMALAQQAGFPTGEVIPLKTLVLYRFRKEKYNDAV